jgi:hypothetical protein
MFGTLDALRGGGFETGVRFGIGALGAGILLGALWRMRRTTRLAPVAGVLFAAAACAALRDSIGVPDGVLLGVLVLAAAGLLVEALDAWWVTSLFPAIPGGWLIATQGGLVEEHWVRWVVALIAVAGGGLMGEFDRRWAVHGFGPVLLSVTAVGVYYTVPDTEQAAVVLGAAVPLVLLGWPYPLARLGFPGAMASAGVLAWTIGAGGIGRFSSIVGGAACLGLFVAEPAARALRAGRRSVLAVLPRAPWVVPVVASAHLGLVFIGARVAGLRPTVRDAIAVVAAEAAVALAILVSLGAAVGGRRAVERNESERGEMTESRER